MSSKISELQVLKSAAGYYIGRTENGMPYDRISDYFINKVDAEWAMSLDKYQDALEGNSSNGLNNYNDPHLGDII